MIDVMKPVPPALRGVAFLDFSGDHDCGCYVLAHPDALAKVQPHDSADLFLDTVTDGDHFAATWVGEPGSVVRADVVNLLNRAGVPWVER